MNGAENKRVYDLARFGIGEVPEIVVSVYNAREEKNVPHRHPGCLEIIYCRRGRGLVWTCAGKRTKMNAGDLVVVDGNLMHCMMRGEKGDSIFTLTIRFPRRGEMAGLALNAAETKELVCGLKARCKGVYRDGGISRQLGAIVSLASVRRVTPLATLRLRNALISLLLAVVEARRPQNKDAGGVQTRVGAIVEEMCRFPERVYSVDDLCARAAVSAPLLFAEFRRQTGLTPHAYQIRARIDRAMKLLRAGAATPRQAAKTVGYASYRPFARAFKAETGITPGTVRKNRLPQDGR